MSESTQINLLFIDTAHAVSKKCNVPMTTDQYATVFKELKKIPSIKMKQYLADRQLFITSAVNYLWLILTGARDEVEQITDIHEYLNKLIADPYQDTVEVYYRDVQEQQQKEAEQQEAKRAASLASLDLTKVDAVTLLTDYKFLQRYLTPQSIQKHAYIFMTSFDIDPTLSTAYTIFPTPPTGDIYGWNYTPYAAYIQGNVRTPYKFKDIVGCRIQYLVMVFNTEPDVSYADLIAMSPTTYKYTNSQIIDNQYNMTLLIEEFKAQSFKAHDDRSFHFSLMPSTFPTAADGDIRFVTTDRNNGWFWFEHPITTFSTLTFTFRNYTEEIQPERYDRFYAMLEFVYLDNADDDT